MKRRRILAALGMVATLVVTGIAWANIRLEAPKDFEVPTYTSSAGPFQNPDFVIHDGEWAAIPFWRPLTCVPWDFNLFDWVDIDLLNNPNDPDCPMLVSGFAEWYGTEPVGVPAITQFRGLGAVPILFVKLADLQAASADGDLTIVELMLMDSLRVGTASYYHEHNHTSGVHPVSHLTVVASGTLEGGGRFELRAVEVGYELQMVQINFD